MPTRRLRNVPDWTLLGSVTNTVLQWQFQDACLAERARPRAQQRWVDFAFEFFSALEHEEAAAAEDGRTPPN